jgi:hypothetical protein
MANSDADKGKAEVSTIAATLRSQKVIIEHSEGDNPQLEPLFANHVELFGLGSDIYLDIGIIRPEEIVALRPEIERNPSGLHTVTFNVLQRVAMSRDTFERLRLAVEGVARAMHGEQSGH